jgi:hypothetical protein
MQVLLETIVVQGFEGSRIVEVLGQWVANGGVLAQDGEFELIGPPIAVLGASAADVGPLDVVDWTIRNIAHGFFFQSSLRDCFKSVTETFLYDPDPSCEHH